MLAFAPDYERLTLMAKVEVFEHALERTPGNDLAKVLWLKSRSSEIWLDRRTNYTRSLAVMSMVKTSFTQEGFFCFRKSPCRELENISSFSCFCGSKHVSFSI
jgi:hypothetical protein